MKSYIRIGVDLAKNVFQVHALSEEGTPALQRKLSRAKFLDFFQNIAPSQIGMEACATAHHWARALQALGHEVVLIPPAYTKPYVKRGKNDAVDAEAICEAMSRPGMRFVPVKTVDQQALLGLHKQRELLIKQQTMAVNALRAFLAEFGLIAAKSIERVPHLLAIGRESKMLPATAKARIEIDAEVLCTLAKAIDGLEQEISRHHACNPVSQLLDGVPGIGTLIASAVVAYVPNPEHFRSGRDFSAWLGLTPREHSSGGKSKLGRISKQGNPYLRKLLVLAATSLLRVQPQRRGPLAEWVRELLARKPARLVTVALANRLARILWAMMKSGEEFRMIIFARGVAAA
ncbi:transposase [Sphingobium sp. AP50]|uniref:IS110 family transposase n=1 Tax=Sphingobium sp. AP50 TaxID=1884369 RepID=UPI0008CD9D9D|nr:IS110 family transposase [Sphingobium sp. AP50]SEK07421.1 transposase [Sphingobium sp. AP50]